MKDITNATTPSKNSNSGNSRTTTPNKVEEQQAVVTSPSRSGDDVSDLSLSA